MLLWQLSGDPIQERGAIILLPIAFLLVCLFIYLPFSFKPVCNSVSTWDPPRATVAQVKIFVS